MTIQPTLSTTHRPEPELHEIDPARLESSSCCQHAQRWSGEGDIAASYRADRIAESGTVRTPFLWRGQRWIVGGRHWPDASAEAYQLVPRDEFSRRPTTYHEKVILGDAEAARHDPNGYYDGVTVRNAGAEWVLSGPPVRFRAGVPRQPGLFEEVPV